MSYVAAVVGFAIGFGAATFLLAELLPYQWWMDFRDKHTWAMPAMGALQVFVGIIGGAFGFWYFQ